MGKHDSRGGRLQVTLRWNASDGRGGTVARKVQGRVEVGIGRKAVAQARAWSNRLAECGEADAGWDWGSFLRGFATTEAEGLGTWLSYSLWALEELQGLMIIEVSGRRHLDRDTGRPQVYVEYLSVAPDNRAVLRVPRKVVGCGMTLLGIARRESIRRGWRGRLGLHSLPGAVGFYESQGFRNLGADPLEGGCHYMEFPGNL